MSQIKKSSISIRDPSVGACPVFAPRHMTHQQYVDLIGVRISMNKGLLRRPYMDGLRPSIGCVRGRDETQGSDRLTKLIADDVALLAEVTSVDRI